MSAICTTLDIFMWTFKMTSWKVQGAKSFFTIREWFDAYFVSVTNQIIFSWAATIPAHLLQKSGLLHPGHPTSSLSDAFDLKQALMHLAFCGLFIEVWFFTTHRALHWPPLFKAIHKKHHRFHAPTAVASM
jgi:sterol desaturase/sphingolipid hydroxylase (fatty acid hydroxylase superfamily)